MALWKKLKEFLGRLTGVDWLIGAVLLLLMVVGFYWASGKIQNYQITKAYNAEVARHAQVEKDQQKVIDGNNKAIQDRDKTIVGLQDDKNKLLAQAGAQLEELNKIKLMVKQLDTNFERAKTIQTIQGTYEDLCAIYKQQGRPCP